MAAYAPDLASILTNRAEHLASRQQMMDLKKQRIQERAAAGLESHMTALWELQNDRTEVI